MKFSLGFLLMAVIASGATIGLFVNNYWMEREVQRTRAHYEAEQSKLVNEANNKIDKLEKEVASFQPLVVRADDGALKGLRDGKLYSLNEAMFVQDGHIFDKHVDTKPVRKPEEPCECSR